MAQFREMVGTVDVPSNTGVEGFLRTIQQILKRPRVQNINIDSKGKVTFKRYVMESEEDGGLSTNYGVDFEDLQPYYVVRNARIQEFIPPEELSAPIVIGLMFDKAAQDQMRPLAFVVGEGTYVWSWYKHTTGFEVSVRDQLFGIPLLRDRHIPDTALLLCAGYGNDAAFIDTQVSYKVEIPSYAPPATNVQVIP